MPVIKSAKKKLRKDKKRTIKNEALENILKNILKKASKSPNAENLRKAFQIADKAVKNKIIHANKAARIKSKLSKLIKEKSPVKKTTASKKTAKSSKTKTSK